MHTIYDDGTFVITDAAFSTPTRLYPLTHATARLRRDPLWLALSAAAIAAAALLTYGDLLTDAERLALTAIPALLLLVGMNMGMLVIDTLGHKRTIVFTRPSKAREIFNALRRAKLAEISGLSADSRSEDLSGK